MNRKAQVFTTISLIVTFAFSTIILLLYPLWGDVSIFLGTDFPVMMAASIWGTVSFSALLYLHETKSFGKRWHYILFSITNVIMVVLVSYLLYQLGTERTVLVRQTITVLPYALWFGLIVFYLWYMPRWSVLQSRLVSVGLVLLITVSALIWFNRPFGIRFTSDPALFLRRDGVVVAWGTNMTATGQVQYSLDGQPSQTVVNQSHGLKDLGDELVRVFVPLSSMPATLDLAATSDGIKAVQPISVNNIGTATSKELSYSFPAAGDEISFVSFSDLHEQSATYEQLAAQIPWKKLDLAVYNGDLVNSTANAQQVVRSIVGLATGDRNLPRIFVRGNHETRNRSARLLDDWLLPAGDTWYQAFTYGNTFFIVLDCGEDKPDDHKEYGGLVDFADYQQEQAAWLQGVLASPEFGQAQYRVVLLHMPIFGEERTPPEFEPVASLLRNNENIDLMVNGHTHIYGIVAPGESGLPYPVAFSGGPEKDAAAAVLVDMGDEALTVKIVDIDGSVVEQIP